jgi:hypothetical protein
MQFPLYHFEAIVGIGSGMVRQFNVERGPHTSLPIKKPALFSAGFFLRIWKLSSTPVALGATVFERAIEAEATVIDRKKQRSPDQPTVKDWVLG